MVKHKWVTVDGYLEKHDWELSRAAFDLFKGTVLCDVGPEKADEEVVIKAPKGEKLSFVGAQGETHEFVIGRIWVDDDTHELYLDYWEKHPSWDEILESEGNHEARFPPTYGKPKVNRYEPDEEKEPEPEQPKTSPLVRKQAPEPEEDDEETDDEKDEPKKKQKTKK